MGNRSITDKEIVDALCSGRTSLDPGWHGNPDNHTFDITLFFGSFDPSHHYKPDAHGHASVTREMLEAWVRGRDA